MKFNFPFGIELWAVLVLSFMSASSAAIPDNSLPEGGRNLLEGSSPQPLLGNGDATLQRENHPEHGEVWRYIIARQPKSPWSVQMGESITGSIKKGDKCLLTFLARSSSGKANGTANVEIREAPDYFKVGTRDFQATTEWMPVHVPFIAAKTVPDGKGGVALHLGGQVQTIEIARVQLLNYGTDFDFAKLPHPVFTYEGRAADASWRKEALARIEKLRKGSLKIEVVDASGKPVRGAEVHAVLKRHAFGFGSAVTAKMLCDPSADGEKYRAIVDECFSRVVFENDLKPFAWDIYKGENKYGGFRKPWLDQALSWLGERRIPVRGHYLCWGPFEPWSEKLRSQPQAIRETVLAHMREKLPAVGDRVCEWDALNHPAAWQKAMCVDTVLGDKFYTEVFTEARKLTKLPLWINEDQVFRPGRQQEEYFVIIKNIIASGAIVDGIGNQAHFHSSFLPSPEEMLRNSDRFAALVPALQLTEFDVNTEGDETLAADFTRDLLITCFSHPAYTGFVMWGFWEGSHWKPETALWRKDWSEKPNAKVWREWVCGKWKTDATLPTDADGKVSVPGFFGRYEVIVKHAGTSTRQDILLENGKDIVTKVILK